MRNYEAPTKYRQVLAYLPTNTDNRTDKYQLITTDEIPTNANCGQVWDIGTTVLLLSELRAKHIFKNLRVYGNLQIMHAVFIISADSFKPIFLQKNYQL